MEELVKYIREKIPSIIRLDFVAELINEKVVLDGKYVGISDKQEGGYIRSDMDYDVEYKSYSSCGSAVQLKESFVMVLGWRKHTLASYTDLLIASLNQPQFRVEITRVDFSKTSIIAEEAGTKSWNDSYHLVKIEFTMTREIAQGAENCLKLKC